MASSDGSLRSTSKEDLANREKTTAEPEYPPTGKLVFILAAAALSIFLVALDTSIVSTAIPKITDEFHSVDDIGWYGSGFFLTFAAFQTFWGKGYKYWTVKRVYLAAIVLFEVGSLVCATAQSSTALIVGRAVAGAGGGGIASGSYLIVALSAPPKKVPALQGVMAASFTVASVIGPLLGGVFTSTISWRWCFYINLPVGGVAFVALFIFFRNPSHAKPVSAPLKEKILQMDIPGTITLLGALVCFFLALQWGGATKPWDSGPVIGTFVAAGVLFLIFVLIEIFSGEHAGVSHSLIRQRTIVFQVTAQALIMGSFFVLLYYLPIYFQVVSGVDAESSGVRSIPFVGGASIFAIVCGISIAATGEFQLQMIFGHALVCIAAGLIYTLKEGSPTGEWVGYEIIGGVGLGFSVQIAIIVLQQIVPKEELGTASALALFFQMLGGAISISIGQSLFQNKLIQELALNVPEISPQTIVAAGATGLRSVLTGEQLQEGIQSYLEALRDAYILSIALAGSGFLVGILYIIIDRRKLKPGLPQAGAAA